ncbi:MULTISPECIES: SDR family oxidoreductase [Sphingobacterium]|uniref:SDR family oxidoreductase n=1 Tax=Sphingobacterium TaxID=28453 RepID=UPI00257EA085|nr:MULTISPECIES: SDR family oxidoreductase [Sphingobacterium]
MSKTIFITGASTGLGKATAKLFQGKGWNVIATMRTPEKETELSQLENVTILPLDVTNPDQINETVAKAIELYNIDVVFNNAGYGQSAALEGVSDEQIVKIFDTNVLGTVRVTKAFIPHFREKRSGLFITTTSLAGVLGFPLVSVYNGTKFALEGWSEGLSYELSMFNIGVKTVAPGAIATKFNDNIDNVIHPAYQNLEKKITDVFSGMASAASTAEQIAAVVYQAATDGKDKVHYVAGADVTATVARRDEIGSEEFRKELSKQILG